MSVRVWPIEQPEKSLFCDKCEKRMATMWVVQRTLTGLARWFGCRKCVKRVK